MVQFQIRMCALFAAGAIALSSPGVLAGNGAEQGMLAAGSAVAEAAEEIGQAVAKDAMDPFRDRPDIDPDDWMFILANPWNEIGDYTPELETAV